MPFGLIHARARNGVIRNQGRAGWIPEALALCERAGQAWAIGGAELNAQALPLADVIEMTIIEADFEGDAHAPSHAAGWVESARETQQTPEGLRFDFVTLTRQS